MKKNVDLVITNANIVTSHGGIKKGIEMKNIDVIYNGCIGIKGEKIVFVGEYEKAKKEIDVSAKKIYAKNKIVLPGFVDPHTHLLFAGSRENELKLKIEGKKYSELLSMGYGIYSTVRATRKAKNSELKNNAKMILKRMLEHGTTTVEIKSGYGLNYEDELRCLRIIKQLGKETVMDIVPTFLGAHAVPREVGRKEYIQIVKNLIKRISKQKLANYCDVFCEKDVFSIEESREILLEAKRNKLGIKIHADELSDFGSALLACELGALSADHLLKTNKNSLKELAKKNVIGVLLPATSLVLGENYANARKMIELNMAIALGSDLCPNCWVESMQLIIALACYQMKLLPEEAINAATINAAGAIGMEKKLGSIEVGKQADIIVLNLENYLQIPYIFGTNHVKMVIKKGSVVWQHQT